jgi:diacylglycerol kinase (ATP)
MSSSPIWTSGSCLIVANPNAGTVSTDFVADVADRAAHYLPSVRVVWTGGSGDATSIVRAECAAHPPDDTGLRVVAVVGGDGTVREVVEGLMAAWTPARSQALFVMPGGTGNSNYRAHWGETPWTTALESALGPQPGPVRMLDLAWVVELGELVVLGAGAGLSAQVVGAAPTTVPAAGGERLAVGLERAAASYVPYPGRVTVDGRVIHEGDTVLANAGGGQHRAWQYRVLPHSVLDDGLLDVCVVGAEVDPNAVPGLLRAGRHLYEPGVVYGRGRQVVIERTDGLPLCFEHDGEQAVEISPRFTLEVVPRVLPVLCGRQHAR